MGSLFIKRFKNPQIDDIGKSISPKQIEDLLKRTIIKIQFDENAPSLHYILSRAIADGTTFYSKELEKIVGAHKGFLVEIDANEFDNSARAFEETLREYRMENANKVVNEDELLAVLHFNYLINIVGINSPELKKANHELYQYLHELIEKGPENRKNTSKTIAMFLRSTEQILKESEKIHEIDPPIEVGKYKNLMTQIYISELVKEGFINYKITKSIDGIDKLTDEEFEQIYIKNGSLAPEEILESIRDRKKASTEQESIEYALKNYKKEFLDNMDSRFAIALIIRKCITNEKDLGSLLKKIPLDHLELLEGAFLREILRTQLPYRQASFLTTYPELGNGVYIKKELMDSLNREQILAILLDDHLKYKNPLSSEELVYRYDGNIDKDNIPDDTKGFSFIDIVGLNQKGYVKTADIIKIQELTNSIEDTKRKEDHLIDIASFYDYHILMQMIENNEVNKKFIENHHKLLDNLDMINCKEAYFNFIQDGLEQSNEPYENYIKLLKSGLELELDFRIPTEYIVEACLQGKVQEQDLIDFYKKGVVSIDAIKGIFLDDQIVEKFESGELDFTVLNALDEKVLNLGILLEEQKIGVQHLVNLYCLEDGLSIEELREISEQVSFGDTNIAELIPNNISEEKVEQLAKNWLISHDDLSSLVERKIISQEKADALAEELATHEMYLKYFGKDSGIIHLTSETEGSGEHPNPSPRPRPGPNPNPRSKQLKNDPELQNRMFSELGFDNKGNIVLSGANNSLDGYEIYSSEDLGVAVFIKNTQVGNATYVMSLQQAYYTLDTLSREERIFKDKAKTGENYISTDATKKAIRESEHIKVLNASRNWGENLLDYMKQVSKKSKEKLPRKSKRSEKVKELIEEIQKDYDDRRN